MDIATLGDKFIHKFLFGNELEAKFFYEETATRFKRNEREFGR